MPFTPFHMGPALAVKAVCGRHFSIPIFAFTQVAIDSEVLVGYSFRRDLSYHKVMHTIAGGTAAAIVALALLNPVIRPGARLCANGERNWSHGSEGRKHLVYGTTSVGLGGDCICIRRGMEPCVIGAGRADTFPHGTDGANGERKSV